jgi:hypothetical protein
MQCTNAIKGYEGNQGNEGSERNEGCEGSEGNEGCERSDGSEKIERFDDAKDIIPDIHNELAISRPPINNQSYIPFAGEWYNACLRAYLPARRRALSSVKLGLISIIATAVLSVFYAAVCSHALHSSPLDVN